MSGDLDQFGPVVIATQFDEAVQNTLEEWAPTYLRFIERQLGLEPEWLSNPRSYVVTSDWDHFPEEKLPAILIMSSEIAKPEMDGRKEYRAHFPIDIGIFVSAKDRKSTEKLAKYYGAAIRTLLLQNGSLSTKAQREAKAPGIAVTTAWEGEKFDVHEADTSQRTIGTAEVKFSTEVRQIVTRLGGPKEPLPPPQGEPAGWPTVTKTTPIVIDAEPILGSVKD